MGYAFETDTFLRLARSKKTVKPGGVCKRLTSLNWDADKTREKIAP
jgi:hypothetical protein